MSEIEFQDIIYEKEDNGILTITLNKPERKNAMSLLTFWELWQAFDQAKKDKQIRVVIMTGAGDAFSSGGYFNMKVLETIPPEIKKEIDLNDIAQKKLCLKMWEFEKPILAAINGLALGAGITMPVTCCDLIYMSETAWASFMFVKRAIIPEFATSFTLMRLLGPQKTKELIFFGEKISAQQMYEMGLVNKVCKPEELIPYTREQAFRLIPPKGPSLALKMMKRALHRPLTQFISDALDWENKGLRKTAASKDFSESLKALKEKRDANFVGK
ncbi:MAG: enoyl-CoA hydratase/isomerase family protein [Candidatus Helarchaeota archaeon]